VLNVEWSHDGRLAMVYYKAGDEWERKLERLASGDADAS
jgi:hypothetical protein